MMTTYFTSIDPYNTSNKHISSCFMSEENKNHGTEQLHVTEIAHLKATALILIFYLPSPEYKSLSLHQRTETTEFVVLLSLPSAMALKAVLDTHSNLVFSFKGKKYWLLELFTFGLL